MRQALLKKLDVVISPRWTFQQRTCCLKNEDMQRLYEERRVHMLGRTRLHEFMEQVPEVAEEKPESAFAFWHSAIGASRPPTLPPVCFDGLQSAACVFKVYLLCYDMNLKVPPGVDKLDCNAYLDKKTFASLLDKEVSEETKHESCRMSVMLSHVM